LFRRVALAGLRLRVSITMSRIFLSHSSANNAEAIAVRDWMATHGWDEIFLDLDPERGGDRWQDALKRSVERCEVVIFLVSPVWAASKWCLAEFQLANRLNKRIFALIVEPTAFEVLPVELAEWQVIDLTAGTRDYVTLPLGTATVAFSSDGLTRLRIGLIQAGIDASHFPWPPANDPNRPPYRGLRPLEADDAGIFFGRDVAVIGALDSLRRLRDAAPPRLLVILGASGAGKSSFLRAGLIPRLARDHREFFVLPIVRPDRAAITGETGLLRALEGAFQAAKITNTRADLRAAIDGGTVTLRPLLQQLADKVTPSNVDAATKPKLATLVLAIDQGEELFLAEGQDEARNFLASLRDLLTGDAPSVIALFTIRSDNYERLQLARELDGVRQATFSLPPMPKGAYAAVIEGPANRLEGPRALKVDDALVEALLTDIEAGGAKDSLPLLAFTLERLYHEFGSGGYLGLEHYRQLGGVHGSIHAATIRALQAADNMTGVPNDHSAKLTLLRRALIPWLVLVDLDTGFPRPRAAQLSEIPEEARPLIHHLVDQRLLSADVASDSGESTIEVSETLLRHWGVVQGWLLEDRSFASRARSTFRYPAPTPKGTKVFISYRRSDTRHVAGRIYDFLARDFTDNEVFFDVDAIPFGKNFRDEIYRSLQSSAALLVIIGPSWVGKHWNKRLWFPFGTRKDDFVLIEVELAFELGIPILPLLVEDTSMPPANRLPASIQGLCYLNAAPVRAGRDFGVDMHRVVELLRPMRKKMDN
jgi:hypothetical protein